MAHKYILVVGWDSVQMVEHKEILDSIQYDRQIISCSCAAPEVFTPIMPHSNTAPALTESFVGV